MRFMERLCENGKFHCSNSVALVTSTCSNFITKMTEAEYEYECKRAELLGIEKPDRNTFLSNRNENKELINETELENQNAELAKELDEQGEKINRTGGGLDEINNILKVTQKKINRLKAVCGSFKNILKFRSEAGKTNDSMETDEMSSDARKNSPTPSPFHHESVPEVERESEVVESKKTSEWDIRSTVDVQMSKLDSLISKAENADVSLCSQNKQMKKFLKN